MTKIPQDMAPLQSLKIDNQGSTTATSEDRNSSDSLQTSDAHDNLQESSFLALPPELRNYIYELAVVDHKATLVLPKMPSLLGVNKQLRKEAGDTFFAHNTFAIPIACGFPSTKWQGEIHRDGAPIAAPANTFKWLAMVDFGLPTQIRSLLIYRSTFPGICFQSGSIFDIDLEDNSSKIKLRPVGRLAEFPYSRRRRDGEVVYDLPPETRSRLKEMNVMDQLVERALLQVKFERMLAEIRISSPADKKWERGQREGDLLLVNFN